MKKNFVLGFVVLMLATNSLFAQRVDNIRKIDFGVWGASSEETFNNWAEFFLSTATGVRQPLTGRIEFPVKKLSNEVQQILTRELKNNNLRVGDLFWLWVGDKEGVGVQGWITKVLPNGTYEYVFYAKRWIN